MPVARPFEDKNVANAFDAFAPSARRQLLAIRDLIFQTAASTDGVGKLQETLRWGQPAYLTPETRSGSTLRLGSPSPGTIALYAHCQTNLIENFNEQFPEIEIEPKRAVLLKVDEQLPELAVVYLARAALIYHQSKRSKSSTGA